MGNFATEPLIACLNRWYTSPQGSAFLTFQLPSVLVKMPLIQIIIITGKNNLNV